MKRQFISQERIEESKRLRQAHLAPFSEHGETAFKKTTGESGEDKNYDPRPLYEKLQEARQKAELDALENNKFKVRRIEEEQDEVEYLRELAEKERERVEREEEETRAALTRYRADLLKTQEQDEISQSIGISSAVTAAPKENQGSKPKPSVKKSTGVDIKKLVKKKDRHGMKQDQVQVKPTLVPYASDSDSD